MDRDMTSKKALAIESAFCKLLQQMEFKKITVSRVCSDAHVSRATFYTYFDGTQALLDEIEDRTLADVLQILEGWKYFGYSSVGENQAAPVYIDICRYCYNQREIFQALFGPYGDEAFIYRYENHIYEDFMRFVKAAGDVRFPELMASSCAGAIIGLCRTWFSDISFATPEELALLHTAIVYRIIHSADSFSDVLQPKGESARGKKGAPDEERDASHWNWWNRGQLFKTGRD